MHTRGIGLVYMILLARPPLCNDHAPIAYMAGISEHIHQSGHPFPLGLYIGFTRLHGVALLREGTMFDSGQDHFAFRIRVARGCCHPWMPRAAASLGCFRRVGVNPCDPVRCLRMHGRLESVRWEMSQDLQTRGGM